MNGIGRMRNGKTIITGNTNIIDAAVYWKENCYIPNSFMCLSFQFQKHLNIGKGGMILTDDKMLQLN